MMALDGTMQLQHDEMERGRVCHTYIAFADVPDAVRYEDAGEYAR